MTSWSNNHTHWDVSSIYRLLCTRRDSIDANLRDGVFLGDTHLLDDIKARIVKTLVEDAKLPPNDVDFDRPIEELGIKSADAVYMCGILEEVFGIEIDPSLIFESNTLAAFAKEIAETAGQDK